MFFKELLASVYIACHQVVDYRVAFPYTTIEPTQLRQTAIRVHGFGDFSAWLRHELMPILSDNFSMFL
jgi:hypothetical protein